MSYLILLILGLLVGGVFMAVLLIGDRREARLAAQKKALQEQITAAREPVEGTWPPPPSASAFPNPSQFASSTKPARDPGASRKMVKTFFRLRNYTVGTVLVAYLIYTCYPRYNLGWVLLATASAAIAVAVIAAKCRKPGQRSDR